MKWNLFDKIIAIIRNTETELQQQAAEQARSEAVLKPEGR